MLKILLYDSYRTGHHMEYFVHLINYADQSNLNGITLAVPTSAINELQDKSKGAIRLLGLPTFDAQTQIQRTVNESEWIVRTVQEDEYTDVIFLAIDPYQYVLGSRVLRTVKCSFHGILFSPPHRLIPSRDSKLSEKTKQWLRRQRKNLQLRWALRNKKLKTLFILDDKEAVVNLNNKYRSVFRLLPDPISREILEEPEPLAELDGVLENERFLLSFGSIIPRKNLEKIILSLKLVSNVKFTLVIAGKGNEQYVQKVRELACTYLGHERIKVIIINRFISNPEMQYLFKRADGIIMMYLNFYGSSGVLGHSASHRKPVLVSDVGLISSLTRQYRLGYTVNNSSESISTGLVHLLSGKIPDGYSGDKYLELKTVENFAATVFSVAKNTSSI